jgi:hypothetical protein
LQILSSVYEAKTAGEIRKSASAAPQKNNPPLPD